MRKQYLSLILAGLMFVSLAAFGQADRDKHSRDTFGSGVEFQFPTFTGSRAGHAALLTESFDSGVPGTWSVLDNAGNGQIWTDMATSGESGNFTGGTGDCASSSLNQGGAVEFDTEMISPVINCANSGTVTLSCLVNYQNFANYDFFNIDVSNDNGGTWTNVLSWNEDHGSFRATPGEAVNMDISAVAAHAANVLVRFHYYDPRVGDDDWYVQVDDFLVEGDGAAGASTVPTLSIWGMMAFTVILMGLVIVIRRKN